MSKESDEFYDSDDMSEIVLKEIATNADVFLLAKQIRFKTDDLIAGTQGFKLYKDLADVVFELNTAPCDPDIFKMYVNKRKEKGEFKNYEDSQIDELINFIFNKENPKGEYVLEHLHPFVKRRRKYKAFITAKNDLEKMETEFSKIADEVQSVRVARSARTLNPFESMVASVRTSGVLTGIPIIDNKTGGIGKGECGLLIGHSGSGKTAVASYMMRQAALAGFNVLYISAEEPAENIVHRWYAQTFRMNYTEMYRGGAVTEGRKREEFDKISDDTREKLNRLRIVDVRDLAPLDVDALKKVVDQSVENGFTPDVVLVDQMDYLKPKRIMQKGAGKWQEYEAMAFELDLFSQYKLGEEKDQEFALWVLHQATGDMKWNFTYNDIAGFKGIVKPFDLAIGIGRETRDSTHINLFSLKVRHSEHFVAPQRAEFEYMTFTDDIGYRPKAEREKEEAKKERAKGKKAKAKDDNTSAGPVVAASE